MPETMKQLDQVKWPVPEGYKFDHDEANKQSRLKDPNKWSIRCGLRCDILTRRANHF
jgi:hypothetical protein